MWVVLYQHIRQPCSGEREVTSYKMTSFRTSYQIEICSFTDKKGKKPKVCGTGKEDNEYFFLYHPLYKISLTSSQILVDSMLQK